jgi:dipeptidyl aminopeptidase/acylaminoacyl peptidase
MSPEDRSAFQTWLQPAALVKGGRVAANWLPDGRFWFVEGAPDETTIKVFDPASGEAAPLFDTAKVRDAYRTAFGREAAGRGLPFDAVAPDGLGGYTAVVETKPHALGADGATLTPLPGGSFIDAFWPTTHTAPETYRRPAYYADTFPVPEMMSPDGRWFASVRDNDLWVRSTVDGRRERMTFDGEPQNGWDVESIRMCPGPGGQFLSFMTSPWSTDSLKLFATRFDMRGISPWLRVSWSSRSDSAVETFMARAGDRIPVVTPHVVDIMRRAVVPIDVPVEDRFLLPIGWSADATSVWFVQFSRDMSWAGVYRADAATGRARLLFEEKTDTFLRIQHETTGGRSGCTLLPDGGFLWESPRDGWEHLHHYDADGGYVRQLTSGDWPVVDVQAVDPAGGFVYFTAHHDQQRPYDIHLCRVPLAGGPVERLTDEAGSHEAQISPDRSYFVDTFSTPDSPPQSVVRRASGEVLRRFAPADISAMEANGWAGAQQVSVKAADGETDLWAVVYKPRDFDPSKSYPVIEHIYAGPQVTLAPHYFALMPYRMGALPHALAALGYVVVMSDARGTPERSKAFIDVTYKEWRRHVTADHAAVIRNLAKDRPWMDLDRVGIFGHSWGGYFTFANMVDTPDLYRAGVCSSPGFDPYDAFIYEPYLGGVPAGHNRAAYEDAFLPNDAGKLQGDLMIVAGTNDMSVWQGSVRMTDALIKAGRPHEFVVLPNQHHLYGDVHDYYYFDKLVGFFERTLKNAEPRT